MKIGGHVHTKRGWFSFRIFDLMSQKGTVISRNRLAYDRHDVPGK